MTEKKRKSLYWSFKVTSVFVSCFFPILAICEKFPMWTTEYGTTRTVGVGSILVLVVLLVIFRKSVFNYLSEKFKLNHAPPLVAWLAMLIGCYILLYINQFIRDLTTVFWMGLVGCAIGTVLTYIAENRYGGKEQHE